MTGHNVSVSAGSAPPLSGLDISGTDPLLVCVVAIEPLSSDIAVSSVVVDDGTGGGGQPLAKLGNDYSAPADGLRWSTWYLTRVTTGSNRRVSATFSTTPFTSLLACESYAGVDQDQAFGPITTANGRNNEPASLTVIMDVAGALPWAHLFSSNLGYVAGLGVVNRQQTSTYSNSSYMVDSGTTYPSVPQ